MEIHTFKFVLLAFACVSIIDSTFTQAEESERFFNEHDFDERDVPYKLWKDETRYSNLLNAFLPKNETFTQVTENSFEKTLEEVKWSTNPPRESVKKRARRKPKIRPSVVKKLVLTRALRRSCLVAHNEARKIVKPPASNMRKLHWDKELESLATSYSRKCLWKHNQNTQHKRFDWVGENLFISYGFNKFDEEYTALAVKYFDDEKEFYNYKKNNCEKGEVCGHYTQVVWADTFRLGCGATQCANVNVGGKIWKKATLFVCNYTPGGNYAGVKPYKTGNGCTGCHETDTCVSDKLCWNQMRGNNFNNATMMNFTEWGPWGSCYGTCGSGIKFRDRTCNTFVREDCEGKFTDDKVCWAGPCNKKRNKTEKSSPKNKNSKRQNGKNIV
ncbi:uncharacterized protein LOC120333047 [Styela clava]